MAALVEDLLLLARLDQTRPVDRRPVDLAVLAADACSDAVAQDHDRLVRLDAPEPVVVWGEGDHLRQAIANLVTNALRHTPADGCVAVVVKPGDDEVHVRVEDTGEGIDDEGVERMFERFWRGDQARSTPGAGLGLAIARGLVEAHGGRIWAERRTGGGTSVSFTLPA